MTVPENGTTPAEVADPALADLRCFLRVVQESSFSAAARALGLPKATVSRRIAQLERSLGAQLLVRTTRSVRATELGVAYAQRAQAALAAFDEAAALVADHQGAPRGRLRISSSVEYGVAVLGPLLARFQREQPGIELELDLSGRRVDLVYEGYDLAVRVGELPDSSLRARRIDTLTNLVCTSPAFVAQHGAPHYAHELAASPALLFTGARAAPRWTLTDGRQSLEVALDVRLRANSHWVLRDAAEAGLGIALLSELIARPALERGTLVQLLPEWRSPPIPVHLLFPGQKHVPPKLRALADFLVANLAGRTGSAED